ncbi:glycosyltransferase family 4 protein [Methanothermobacter tenebrarum]|uniref:Glycosyltransferase family 1 protein n=1 Tax=Methanothermobacter tenebrarum TaxID=680118 RepID=A0A328PJS3_9EURY|nr:glycosyltransferase family 4 protein [Methanothermobacter tenebrarum]MBC7100423.1 glycosyltransferase family 4 protein [Methanobacteriales archaeon]MBC7118360.1 glycosyltransferase family 4 protein [Methanobacteriaceae archaeon]NPV64320.1 glycosyltransferase family 4 protein [Methanobacteriaceae archaeon]RAO79986.1 glycosyltransferase family 1 protein [Methanothermobacter tenebrarum]
MKIAFIYDCAYPWVKGGAEKRIYEIGKRLAMRGHEVHFFCLKWWEGKNKIQKDGIYYHGVGEKVQLYKNGKRSINEGLYFGLKILTSFKGDADIIDCQQSPYFPCFSAKLHSLNKKASFFITWYEIWDDYWFEYFGKKGLFGLLVEKFVSKIPHIPIAISERIKNDMIKYLGMPENLIKVVPNGVDFHKIRKVAPKDENLDIVYVGRLISHKNVDVLLKAIALLKNRIPDIKCGIIGNGPEKEHLIGLSKKLDISNNVKFFGFIEKDEEVYSYMKSSKIFVLPSTREGFPNTILEANSCGLPAIIVRHEKNAGTGVVKEGYNGFIVDLSPEEIADRISNLLENDLSNLKRNALEFAKKHDWNIIVNKIEKIYKESL